MADALTPIQRNTIARLALEFAKQGERTQEERGAIRALLPLLTGEQAAAILAHFPSFAIAYYCESATYLRTTRGGWVHSATFSAGVVKQSELMTFASYSEAERAARAIGPKAGAMQI